MKLDDLARAVAKADREHPGFRAKFLAALEKQTEPDKKGNRIMEMEQFLRIARAVRNEEGPKKESSP